MKQLLIAYFLGNTSAENYQNPFMYVIVILCNISVVFRHSVVSLAQLQFVNRYQKTVKGLMNLLVLLGADSNRNVSCTADEEQLAYSHPHKPPLIRLRRAALTSLANLFNRSRDL